MRDYAFDDAYQGTLQEVVTCSLPFRLTKKDICESNNPRVSRSSALASKAKVYCKIASKLFGFIFR
jgi:carbamoylphosphate synthase large subunit